MSTDQTRPGLWRSALALGLVAIAGTALLAVVNELTSDRIAEQERRVILQQLEQLVTPERYDNELHDDRFEFSNEAWFPAGQTVTVYRARKNGIPVAAVFTVAAIDGYNGRINLLVGINADASLSGVRVTSHRETPGLGDGIELTKDDWILGFDGRSSANTAKEKWTVKRDGGVFDQFTGATITPRAVVKAVRRTLDYFESHHEELFEHAADQTEAAE